VAVIVRLKNSSKNFMETVLALKASEVKQQDKGKRSCKEEKEQIGQELLKALRQNEDELSKEAWGEIIYLEVDGTNIHLQQEEKTKDKLKLGIISKWKERRYKMGLGEAKKL
jgi:hypothetical protein